MEATMRAGGEGVSVAVLLMRMANVINGLGEVRAENASTVTLAEFVACQSDDSVKTVLELVHEGGCGRVVCDIEPGDTLSVLVSMANDHECDVNEER